MAIGSRFRLQSLPEGFYQPEDLLPGVVAVLGKERTKPHVPLGVMEGTYRLTPPLIRPSRLTSKARGGVGKDLSEGWNLNFAVGCTHACPFCYVDPIHKRFGVGKFGPIVREKWGDYFLLPINLDDAIGQTSWNRWRGKEVMMSSTHDPYLPQLAGAARRILEAALPNGVRFCIQTRSVLVSKDIEFLAEYASQIRLQVSIATLDGTLARLIEPRVPPPEARLRLLGLAKQHGLRIGAIIAPVLPEIDARPDVRSDLRAMVSRLAPLRPEHVYGESMHVRGENRRLVAGRLGQELPQADGFDKRCERWFKEELRRFGLRGTWWPES